MNWKTALFCCTALILAGCNLPRPTSTAVTQTPIVIGTPLVTIIPAQTVTSLPIATVLPTSLPSQPPAASATNAPSPLPSPSLTAQSASYTPFLATTNVDAAKLRTGPGYLFPALGQLGQGAKVTVLGRSPGDEWIYVRTAQQTQGWVFALLLEGEQDLKNAPSVEPGQAQIVKGLVLDAAGTPVNGIQFALVQGSGTNAPRTDATTGVDGVFYAFFPPNTSGAWSVSYTAISCSSRLMDAQCNCKSGACGMVTPASTEITIPNTGVLEFRWG